MKQETKRKIEISNLHEFADSLILIDNRIDRCKNIRPVPLFLLQFLLLYVALILGIQ